MRVALFSNFLNHHQLPFCEEMWKLTNGNFTFVATEEIPQERLQMGYADMNRAFPFVLRTYESVRAEEEATRLAQECDVILTGSAPEKYTIERIENNKLTFRYSERIYKRGLWRAVSPKGYRNIHEHHTKYKDKPLYMLCASAYTASDFAIQGAYLGKTFQWGYFPETDPFDDVEQLIEKKYGQQTDSHCVTRILWAGRLLSWKHPEAAIALAKELKKKEYSFELDIIGNGELENRLRQQIQQNRLQDSVHLLGAMTPADVRKHMERADIFLFTSDFHEGWGAVLNESMSSGCAVVASHAIGSVPFLIHDKKNGLIYKNGDQRALNACVQILLERPELRRRLGIEAYKTITGTWSAKSAAERFATLSECLKENKKSPFLEGPCSIAMPIPQWKMFRECKK